MEIGSRFLIILTRRTSLCFLITICNASCDINTAVQLFSRRAHSSEIFFFFLGNKITNMPQMSLDLKSPRHAHIYKLSLNAYDQFR